jgi:SAM-dependent methyltransferase
VFACYTPKSLQEAFRLAPLREAVSVVHAPSQLFQRRRAAAAELDAARMVAEHCVLCGGSSISPLYAGLSRCGQCGHTFAIPELGAQQFSHLYDEDYFRGAEYRDYQSDQTVIERNFAAQLAAMRPFLVPGRHRNLLEIGCAYGFFLRLARPHFESVQGLDLSEPAVRHCTERLGLNVARADLLEWEPPGELDVVCMWETIEHLTRPDLYLRRAAQYMRAGALIAITTGDIGSLNARLRRSKWRLIHPPTHVHYFSRQSMTGFLDKLGFSVVHDGRPGFSRSLGSIAYGSFVLRHGWWLPSKVLQALRMTNWPLYLNLYDIMYVIARKR